MQRQLAKILQNECSPPTPRVRSGVAAIAANLIRGSCGGGHNDHRKHSRPYPRKYKHKVDLLREMVAETKSYAKALTESHLRQEILHAEVHIPGFTMFRADRTEGTAGGGVIVYTKDTLQGEVKLLSSGSNGIVECVVLHLVHLNIILSYIYRPLSCCTSKFQEAMERVRENIENLGPPIPSILIYGDFNIPNIKWKQQALVTGGTTKSQSQAKLLKEIMSTSFLEQLISEEIRQNNILDLVLTNKTDIVNNV